MRPGITTTIMILALIMASCKKDLVSPPAPVKKILLKDIIVPGLPSPYYHFEYRVDSTISNVSFASGFTMYDVFYSGNSISEMRNNIIVNHDTLRYVYDNLNNVVMIKFFNDSGVLYRHVLFNYDGQRIKSIYWDHKEGTAGFIIDRTLTLAFFPDGNVKEIKEHRPAINGQTETEFTTRYDQYDDKINVDDFSLLLDGFHDHLFLLSGVHIQKNNPLKEVRTGDGVNYTVDYTYTYNNDGAPLTKNGELLFTNGGQSGQRFQTSTLYSYY